MIAESRHGFPPIDDMVDMYTEFAAVVDITGPDALGAIGADGRLVFEGHKVSFSTSGGAFTHTPHGRRSSRRMREQ
ncbi:hypothetical protein GCM10020255_108050 [Rhodococcus baikonurensis]